MSEQKGIINRIYSKNDILLLKDDILFLPNTMVSIEFKTPIYFELEAKFIKRIQGVLYTIETKQVKKYFPNGTMHDNVEPETILIIPKLYLQEYNKTKKKSDYEVIVQFHNILEFTTFHD